MKNQAIRWMPKLMGCLKCTFYQLSAVFKSDFVTNNHSGIQINNGTDINVLLVPAKICNIADPNLVWHRNIKLLIKTFLKLALFLIINRLGVLTNTYQTHISHQFPDGFIACSIVLIL